MRRRERAPGVCCGLGAGRWSPGTRLSHRSLRSAWVNKCGRSCRPCNAFDEGKHTPVHHRSYCHMAVRHRASLILQNQERYKPGILSICSRPSNSHGDNLHSAVWYNRSSETLHLGDRCKMCRARNVQPHAEAPPEHFLHWLCPLDASSGCMSFSVHNRGLVID